MKRFDIFAQCQTCKILQNITESYTQGKQYDISGIWTCPFCEVDNN